MSPGERALQGQTAVVTGGSKGIGLAIAHALAAAGADVVLVARTHADLDAAVAEVRAAAAGAVSGVVADVSSAEGVGQLFGALRESTPGINIFVANAGTGSYIPFLEISPAQWDEIVGLNLTGTFHCVQQAARMMLEHEHANRVILVVSSIRSDGARPGVSAYAATKAGINQLAARRRLRTGPPRGPGQRAVAGHDRHPARARQHARGPREGQDPGAHGPPGPAGGHGGGRCLPLQPGGRIRHGSEPRGRRR